MRQNNPHQNDIKQQPTLLKKGGFFHPHFLFSSLRNYLNHHPLGKKGCQEPVIWKITTTIPFLSQHVPIHPDFDKTNLR